MIAVFTCKHGRDEVNALFLENMRWLREDFDLEVFMVTTHGEKFKEEWIHTMQFPNRPLGRKWNASIAMALADKRMGTFVGMGDDDLISKDSLLALVNRAYRDNHVGTKSVTFVSPKLKKASNVTYQFKCDKLIGAGRTFTRKAVEDSAHFVNFRLKRHINNGGNLLQKGQILNINIRQAEYLQCRGMGKVVPGTYNFQFFTDDINSALDHSTDMNLVLAGHLPHAIELPDEIIDVKTDENIWPYSRVSKNKGSIEIDYAEAIEWLPSKQKDMLNALA